LINLPPASRGGIWAPIKVPGFCSNTITLGAVDENGNPTWRNAKESYAKIIASGCTRPPGGCLLASLYTVTEPFIHQ
jgi:hypothetical protein